MRKKASWGTIAAETAIGTATVAGVGAGIAALGKLYGAAGDALTKKKDFNRMLNFSPEVRHLHKNNPKLVNAAFNTLRENNYQFSKDPLVASTFVSHMVEMQGQSAFESALQMHKSGPGKVNGIQQAIFESSLRAAPNVYSSSYREHGIYDSERVPFRKPTPNEQKADADYIRMSGPADSSGRRKVRHYKANRKGNRQ